MRTLLIPPAPVRILAAAFVASAGAILSPRASLFMYFVALANWSTLAVFIVPKPYREWFAYAMLAAVVVCALIAKLTG